MSLWNIIRRLIITIVGAIIIGIGIVLLVIPGPGILVIALGMFILSLEYPWAKSVVDWLKRKLERRRSGRG